MTEKNKSEKMTNASKPVPMKLFAAWEVDRTPSNCIPRLCTLRVTRLRVCGALGEAGGGAAGGAGAGAVTLAARMHSSKRTLRSNDITVPPMDVELDLCFSLQYPHFVKRDGNRLQIMLQRRKKYKNRTILGYKTLAEGVIRMDQVLQRSMDMELELTSVGGKVGAGAGQPVARLTITGLASTPVDHDTKNNNTLLITERGYSDEEEEGEFSSVEEADEMTYGAAARRRTRQLAFNKGDLSYTKLSRSHEHELSFMERERKIQSYIRAKAQDSDSELEHSAKRKGSRGKLAQRNLKQKFAALLRRFRVPEDMAERGAARDTHNAQRDIDELFQELESLSCGEGEDSGPDQMDTISIGSTPKPSLRPFFSSSRSLANQEHHRHSNVTRHASLASAAELRPRDRHPSVPLTESEAIRSSAGDERGSEGNSDGDATLDAPVSGASVSSSPPNETKEDKRSRLFRSATSGGNLTPAAAARKKNSLVVGTERPLSAHELPAQSPTAIEPRRTVLEQVSRVLGEEGPLPECVAAAPAALARALAALGVPAVLAPGGDARALVHALLARAAKQERAAHHPRVRVRRRRGGGGGAARARRAGAPPRRAAAALLHHTRRREHDLALAGRGGQRVRGAVLRRGVGRAVRARRRRRARARARRRRDVLPHGEVLEQHRASEQYPDRRGDGGVPRALRRRGLQPDLRALHCGGARGLRGRARVAGAGGRVAARHARARRAARPARAAARLLAGGRALGGGRRGRRGRGGRRQGHAQRLLPRAARHAAQPPPLHHLPHQGEEAEDNEAGQEEGEAGRGGAGPRADGGGRRQAHLLGQVAQRAAQSVHRRHRMERREVLPAVDAVADARQDLPRGHLRGAPRAARDLGLPPRTHPRSTYAVY